MPTFSASGRKYHRPPSNSRWGWPSATGGRAALRGLRQRRHGSRRHEPRDYGEHADRREPPPRPDRRDGPRVDDQRSRPIRVSNVSVWSVMPSTLVACGPFAAMRTSEPVCSWLPPSAAVP